MNRSDLIEPISRIVVEDPPGTITETLVNNFQSIQIVYSSIRVLIDHYIDQYDENGNMVIYTKWEQIDELSSSFGAPTVDMEDVDLLKHLSSYVDSRGNSPRIQSIYDENSGTYNYKVAMDLWGYLQQGPYFDGWTEETFTESYHTWTTDAFTIPEGEEGDVEWYALSYLLKGAEFHIEFSNETITASTIVSKPKTISTSVTTLPNMDFSDLKLSKFFLTQYHTGNMFPPSSYTKWFYGDSKTTQLSIPDPDLSGIPTVSSYFVPFTSSEKLSYNFPTVLSAYSSLMDDTLFLYKNDVGWCSKDGKCQLFRRKTTSSSSSQVWELRYVINDRVWWHLTKEKGSKVIPLTATWNTWPDVDVQIGALPTVIEDENNE